MTPYLIFNKGLQLFIEQAKTDAAAPVVSWNYKYRMKRKGGCPLDSNVAKWSQVSPFNKYSLTSDGREGVVGCGVLAVGMLLTHYKWPNVIRNRDVDWEAIVENKKSKQISRFLEDLASDQYLNATYVIDEKTNKENPNSRNITSDSISVTFKKLGFELDQSWDTYPFHNNRVNIFNFLKSGIAESLAKAPLLFYGNCSGIGHFWIVDGFIEMEKYVSDSPSMSSLTQEADLYLHIIWGWGGSGNGYYYYFLKDKQINDSSKNGEKIDYKFGNLRVFGRYKPNNQ